MSALDASPGDAAEANDAGGFVASTLRVDGDLVEQVRWNSDNLVAAIVVDQDSGDVLMLAWMDPEALRRTLESGRSWFWSRSRQEYWRKGDTSGDRQWVREVRIDCDGDAVLLRVDQEGAGACHTGEWSCFYRVLAEAGRGALEATGAEWPGTEATGAGEAGVEAPQLPFSSPNGPRDA